MTATTTAVLTAEYHAREKDSGKRRPAKNRSTDLPTNPTHEPIDGGAFALCLTLPPHEQRSPKKQHQTKHKVENKNQTTGGGWGHSPSKY